jgi:hypothetical protein
MEMKKQNKIDSTFFLKNSNNKTPTVVFEFELFVETFPNLETIQITISKDNLLQQKKPNVIAFF